MALLNLFRDDATLSKELALDEAKLQYDLKRFLSSYTAKQKVLSCLQRGESVHLHLHTLREALQDELAAVEEGERAEREIIADLRHLSKESSIKRIEQLASMLDHAHLRDRGIIELIRELRELLESEAHKVKRLSDGEADLSVVQDLTDLLTIEKHVVEKLASEEDLRGLFHDLYLGERREKEITQAEDRLMRNLYAHMTRVVQDEDGTLRSTSGSYLSELTARVFNKLETMVLESVERGYIHDHESVDVEYVHSGLFERFVRSEIETDRNNGKFVPSERTIVAFIEMFRRIYHELLEPQISTTA